MMHWIKNGPEVKKPCGDCLIRTKDGFTDIAQWSHDPDCLIWSNTQNVYCDDEVVHFAVIASPLSRSRRMIDPNLLREITEKVRGIAYDQNDGNGVTAVLPTDDMLCAIREFTADGVNVGRCYHFVGRGTVRTCPRHGNVTEVQRRYRETGKLTDDNPKGADCGN